MDLEELKKYEVQWALKDIRDEMLQLKFMLEKQQDKNELAAAALSRKALDRLKILYRKVKGEV